LSTNCRSKGTSTQLKTALLALERESADGLFSLWGGKNEFNGGSDVKVNPSTVCSFIIENSMWTELVEKCAIRRMDQIEGKLGHLKLSQRFLQK